MPHVSPKNQSTFDVICVSLLDYSYFIDSTPHNVKSKYILLFVESQVLRPILKYSAKFSSTPLNSQVLRQIE